jgi:hypothetical protein
MDSRLTNRPTASKARPAIKKTSISQRFNPQIFLYLLILIAVVLAFSTAWQQPQGLGWLFMLKPKLSPPAPQDVGVALGPILALALMIERVMETIFNIFERNWDQVARFGTASSEGAGHLNNLLDLYNGKLTIAMRELEFAVAGTDSTDQTLMNAIKKKVRDAELQVGEASAKLAALTRDPKYLAWKRTITIWLGLMLGLIVAIVSDEGVFEHLNMSVPRILDMMVTGFVIGAGSGPMHSLIGILQSAKSTLENVGSLTGVSALEKDVQELKSAINKTDATEMNQG